MLVAGLRDFEKGIARPHNTHASRHVALGCAMMITCGEGGVSCAMLERVPLPVRKHAELLHSRRDEPGRRVLPVLWRTLLCSPAHTRDDKAVLVNLMNERHKRYPGSLPQGAGSPRATSGTAPRIM
ncbi:hypothetical protein Bbelb_332620 [Branchiostoma belcheri]|nr:hypothetical protein Bbelb_332620 [Branchiostoma belcheri]